MVTPETREEFVAALEHVVGRQENVAAICIGPEDDMEQRRADIVRGTYRGKDAGKLLGKAVTDQAERAAPESK